MSGEQGGHKIGPSDSLHQSLKFRIEKSRTIITKYDAAPYCVNHIFRLIPRSTFLATNISSGNWFL